MTSMDRADRERVYPRHRRPPFWKEHLRFWRSLLSSVSKSRADRHLRSALLLSSPAFVRELAWRHYVSPVPAYQPASLSPAAEAYVERLRQDGIVALDRNFADLADYVRDRYFAASFELPPDSPLRANGLQISHSVSLADTRLHDVLFDPEICAVVCNYYGRQAYYRDNPTVHKERTARGSKPLISGVFHSDSYRQISFVLLLGDLTEADTHMEYAVGSHRHRQPSYDRAQIDQDAVSREFKLAHVVGRKGTLYIFDTEGLHRGAYHRDASREIVHVNVTPGAWPFTDHKYDALDSIFPDPAGVPTYVRAFVDKAIK
jgi:hypothetical protein